MGPSFRIVLIVIGPLAFALSGGGSQTEDRKRKESEQHFARARSLFDQKNFAEAAAEARRARELDEHNPAAWKLSGLSLQLARNYPESEQEFIEGLDRFPGDAELWFYLSRVRYLQHKLKTAQEAAREALRIRHDFADALTQLGLIQEAKQELTSALQSYEAAIDLNRRQSRPETMPLVQAAELLLKLGRLEESERRWSAAANVNPHSARIRLFLGRVLERLGRTQEAETEYQAAIALGGGQDARASLARVRSGTSSPASGKTRSRGLAVNNVAPIHFVNRAAHSGLDFVLRNSATPNKYQIETMTGGVAVLDYDGDGRQDIYFANGAELPALRKSSPLYWNRLYRNDPDGTFTDVTARAGVAGEGYGMGVAAADFDNDGDTDIFVAGVNKNILFRNNRDGTFTDITSRAGLEGIDPERGKMWSVAGAWLDYDRDGLLDLFVVNYCKWSISLDPYCGAALPGYRTYCFPDRYEGLPNQLFRNNGDGTFSDVSRASGIFRHIGKGMGIAVADFDDDGWVDVFVANDTLPNFLFRNNAHGGFEEIALNTGVAVPESGAPVSSMGVDFKDYDNDGRPDLIVSALEGETFPLFRNIGKSFFVDETYASGLGMMTARRSGWSLGLFDFNNDGYKDLFTVNAHVNDNIELFNEQTYRQPNSLFANLQNGTFSDVSALAGPDFQAKRAHRGCAFADFNNDGKMDAVTTELNEPAELFLNESAEANHWLLVELVGTRGNRDGIGARLILTSASGTRQFNHVTTSVGYASSSDKRVHFGLGLEKLVRTLEIRWPSGAVQILKEIWADRLLRVTEPNHK